MNVARILFLERNIRAVIAFCRRPLADSDCGDTPKTFRSSIQLVARLIENEDLEIVSFPRKRAIQGPARAAKLDSRFRGHDMIPH